LEHQLLLMKNILSLIILLFTASPIFSQAPGIRWQQTLGASGYDQVSFTIKTNDNGLLVLGMTGSNDGGFSVHGDLDLWVEKFTSDGISQWRKVIGGSLREEPSSFQYNTDGSIVVLGLTTSSDGDITNQHGAVDIWVCKLDISGNLLWQKCFGGSNVDLPSTIIKATGGGYIFSGETESSNGDITLNRGGGDAWVVKIDETGAIVWQKTLGGTKSDGTDSDNNVLDLIESPDGSILFCTETNSNDGNVIGYHGNGASSATDIWLIKLSSVGDIIWNNCFGGIEADYGGSCKILPSGEIYLLGMTDSPELPSFHDAGSGIGSDIYFCRISSTGTLLLEKCFGGSTEDYSVNLLLNNGDGSCVIAGETESNDGDVVGHHGAPGNFDIWVFKIDAAGNIIWQKTLGGSSDDNFLYEYQEGITDYEYSRGSIIKTNDGGFLFVAFTGSNDGDVTGFHPISITDPTGGDIWVVKLSDEGELVWQKALGGARGDLGRSPLEFAPNDFIITGITKSRNGDIQTNHGDWDAWLIRLGAVNRIKGTVFIDNNGNGIKDAADSLYSDVTIKSVKGSETRTAIPLNGNFLVEVDSGSYNTTLTTLYPYFTITPITHPSSFSTYFNTDSFSFALQPLPGIKDLVVYAIPYTVARPGFPLQYGLYYKNAGTIPLSATELLFKKDPRLIVQTAVPPSTSTVGDTLKWNLGTLNPQQEGIIILNMTIAPPPASNVGDTLSSLAIIGPVTEDVTPADDTSQIKQRVQGAVDPNDKMENFGGSITNQQVASGEYINYIIRFQNTGTDTAFNVYIRDTLDSKLDWNSFQMIASSHPYQLAINSSNQYTWNFYGINLPDSNINEPGSHGFIAYRVKPKTTLATGDQIVNDASIYFDFNLPVETNQALTLVSNILVSLPVNLVDFTVNYEKPDALLQWTTAEEINTKKFEIERGVDPFHFVSVGSVAARGGNSGGQVSYQFRDGLTNISGEKFYYRLRMVDADNKYSYSNIALVKRNGIVVNEVSVNPNPARTGAVVATINYNKNVQALLRVTDLQGRTLLTRSQYLNKGYNLVPLTGISLPAGTYFLQIRAGGNQMVTRFVIAE
jgi:uncharacterized repeat protein (TIGR01451 family)